MEIIFEDDNYIILNKPAGLIVHPDGKAQGESVTGWLAEKYPALAGVGGETEVQSGDAVARWGLAHRIDRDTSGILVVAKNQPAFDDLQKQFQEHEVEKIYNAFVYGRVTIDVGTIDLPIGRSKGDFRRWSAGKDTKGTMREAVTDYRVIHKTNEVTFVEARPQTGRTHQIRVHLRSLGNPVVCDALYAPRRPSLLGFTRLALHARSISFIGVDGKAIFAEAPYPADFENALKMLGIKG